MQARLPRLIGARTRNRLLRQERPAWTGPSLPAPVEQRVRKGSGDRLTRASARSPSTPRRASRTRRSRGGPVGGLLGHRDGHQASPGPTRHRPASACAGRRSGRTPAPGAACKDAGAAHGDRTRLRQRASAARPRGVGPGSASQAGAQGIRSAGVKVPRGPHRARDMNMMNEPGPSARLRPPGRRGVLPPAVDVSPSRRDDSCICTMRAEAACPEHGPRAAAAAGEQEDTDGPPTHLADPLYRSTLPGRA